MSYTPQQGSVAWKVIEFLTTNPEEELSANEVSAKFDCTAGGVHSMLCASVDAGLLKRAEVDDELVYRLGAGTPAIKPNKAANPSLGARGASWPAEVSPPRSSRKPLPAIDLAAVAIDNDVAIPPTGGRLVQHDWPALFNRMKPGQSCAIPAAFKYVLGKACGEFKKTGQGEMSVRRANEDELRLWRVK